MPNHITNRITLIGKQDKIDNLVEDFSTYHPRALRVNWNGSIVCKNENDRYGWYNEEDSTFSYRDSNDDIVQYDKKVESLEDIPDGFEPVHTDAFTHFPDFQKIISPPDDPAYRDEPNQYVAKESPNWWYNWNVNSWGTKWNSYSFSPGEEKNQYIFQTAWSCVPKIIKAMVEKHPDVDIIYEYADEDLGSNFGKMKFFYGGRSIDFNLEEEKGFRHQESLKLLYEIHPWAKDYIKKENGKYILLEEEI